MQIEASSVVYLSICHTCELNRDRVCAFQCVRSDIEKVLREDKEKLRQLQKSQPRFSEEQKKELIEVHPWIKKGGLPKAIDIKVELNTPSSSDIHC